MAAGIPSPAPVLIKNNVLVMDFLGKGGWPAPRLRDVQLSAKKIKVRVQEAKAGQFHESTTCNALMQRVRTVGHRENSMRHNFVSPHVTLIRS